MMANELFTIDCPNTDCVSSGRTDQIEVDAEAIVVCGDCGTELRNDFPQVEDQLGSE